MAIFFWSFRTNLLKLSLRFDKNYYDIYIGETQEILAAFNKTKEPASIKGDASSVFPNI